MHPQAAVERLPRVQLVVGLDQLGQVLERDLFLVRDVAVRLDLGQSLLEKFSRLSFVLSFRALSYLASVMIEGDPTDLAAPIHSAHPSKVCFAHCFFFLPFL